MKDRVLTAPLWMQKLSWPRRIEFAPSSDLRQKSIITLSNPESVIHLQRQRCEIIRGLSKYDELGNKDEVRA